MFKDNFHHDTIRKYYTYFAALFSNVFVDRTLPDGETASRIRIPLHFAKMEHALERVLEDPSIDRPDAISLPAMSFDMIDMKYAPSRKQPTRTWASVVLPNDPNHLNVMFVPVPYDFHFRLSVMVKNINDGLQIVEQITPYFSPDFTAKLDIIPEMGIVQDVPLVLESCTMDFNVPSDYKTRVTYIWVLDFVLQGALYGPEKKWPLIKFSNVNFFIWDGTNNPNNDVVLTMTSQPGLTANGDPTTDPAQSIPYLQISITDNYGYIDLANTTIP